MPFGVGAIKVPAGSMFALVMNCPFYERTQGTFVPINSLYEVIYSFVSVIPTEVFGAESLP